MEALLEKNKFSVCTPTYNRAKLLHRVYDSLIAQTYQNFEWIIIDDGSNDDTEEIVERFKAENKINIKYLYQQNGGKHSAVNKGVEMATGEFFVIADSDDGFVAESLEIMLAAWDNIPKEKKTQYRGVACRCKDQYGNLVGGGTHIEDISGCTNELDVKYKSRYNFELWGMTKTTVMRQFPFPIIAGLRFYPEAVIWDNISREYDTKYINDALRIYFLDQEDSTTYAKSSTRFRENYFLWLHYLNDIPDYMIYVPKEFVKAILGITRDGYLGEKTLSKILKDINRSYIKVLVLILSPIGWLFSKIS